MPQEYSLAPAVERIAAEIIHDLHSHLGPVRIVYVFASESIKRKGKELWGRAKLVTGLNAYLAGVDANETEPFFVIEISKPIWLILTDPQKRALVDHELSHCDVDIDTSKLALRGHDLEEFSGVVRRHGLWRDDVIAFVEAAKAGAQRDLFEKEVDADTKEAGFDISKDETKMTLIGPDGEVLLSTTGKGLSEIAERVSGKRRPKRNSRGAQA